MATPELSRVEIIIFTTLILLPEPVTWEYFSTKPFFVRHGQTLQYWEVHGFGKVAGENEIELWR